MIVSLREAVRILLLSGTVLVAWAGVAGGKTRWTPSGSYSGVPLAFEPCRVSAFPFNRVWEGHQRSVDQTKEAWFVNFDVAQAGVLSLKTDVGGFRIRPLSRMKDARQSGDRLEIPINAPCQFVVETGGTEVHVFANPPFRHVPVPGELYFGPGVHDAGVIEPKSGQTVCLDAGATVYGSILVHHAENVRIVGRGILDSSRIARADHRSEQYRRAVAAGIAPGPKGAEMAVNAFTCYASTNVTVEGITFRDSPRWTVIVRNASKNVVIDNVKLVGMWRYNSDGVDFCASENCTIRNSFIRTFDDCIVTRAPFLSDETTDCRGILAENCVLWCDWGKNLEVWSGSVPSTIENVVYRNCRLVNISWMACDVTTRYASPRTCIRNVTVEDLEIDMQVPPMQEQIQETQDMKYSGGVQAKPLLLTVDCGPIGRDTGNQGIEEGVGTGNACVRYENLAFRRFRILGDGCKSFERNVVMETAPHYKATGVIVEDVPGEQVQEAVRGPEVWLELMGGNVRKDGLRCDLEAIKSAGLSGVHFFHIDKGGAWPDCPEQIRCMSGKWEDVVSFLGDECNRLGLKLTVQNCPGWSQSGGPWISVTNAMREAAYARAEVVAGDTVRRPPVPERYQDADSDWRDIAVLAFPTPLGEAEAELTPAFVTTNGLDRTYVFPGPVSIRTLTLPGLVNFNEHYAYHEPWMHVKLEAVLADGSVRTACDTDLPKFCWRDYVYTLSLACDEFEAREWRYSFTHDYPIAAYHEPRFHSSARQTDWEAKSGLVLRSLLRERPPRQDPRCWIGRGAVIDLTDHLRDDGSLDWAVPEGKWTVLRIGHVNAKRVNSPAPPAATGWECDKLAPEGIEANFRGYVERLRSDPLKGKMHGVVVDSWECFGQTWTPRMERYFRESNGYEARCLLPALFGWVIESPEATESFLTDWRRTIGKLITKNYYGHLSELAHAQGLSIAFETAFGDIIAGDILEYWKYADEPMCEFWLPHADKAKGFVGSSAFKPVGPCASAAHVYGKRRVTAEAFTEWGISWNEDFKAFRDVANRHFAQGVTHLALQSYTHAPNPDALPPGGCMGGYDGSPFTRLQTWWKHMPEFTGWLRRCEERLEEGVPVQDVLWYLGDAVDHCPDAYYPFPEGYRYDYLNHDVLTNRLSVRDGAFVIPEGASWKVLWVPDAYRLSSVTRARLAALAAVGGKVVMGDKTALLHALSELSLEKDVETVPALGDEPSDDFMWLHRRTGGVDRYFVAAGTNGYRGRVTFRAAGPATVYNPVTRERFEWRNGTELMLPPSGSAFVEFNGLEKGVKPVETLSARELTGWALTFPDGTERTLERLASWSEIDSLSREQRAFSGTATYETSFDYNEEEGRLVLDLGRVESVAKVFVNGKPVLTLWCEPYSCELTEHVKAGRNVLRIEVTNTWRNRVVYDLGQPEKDRKTWILYQPEYNPSSKDPLVPAGLLGPAFVRSECKRGFPVASCSAEFITPFAKRGGCDGAYFERRFTNGQAIARAQWRVTGLGVFEAFVNGRRVGTDFLKPGFTENGKCRHVYSYDVTGLLNRDSSATNVLSATVTPGWWCDEMMRGEDEKPWQTGDEVAFWAELSMAQADGSERKISTDADWLASYSGPVVTAGIYEGEVYDASRKPRKLQQVRISREFTGELRPATAKVVLREDLALKPVTTYVTRGTIGAKDGEFGKARSVTRYADGDRIVLEPGDKLVVDFGQNCSAVPSFKASGVAWAKITVRHAEMLNEANGETSRGNDGPAGLPYLASLRSARAAFVVTPGGGERCFQPRHAFFGYRYLLITTDEKVTLRDFRSTPVSSVTREMERGSIVTGNARVNRLIENIRWSALSNFLSIPTDCPQRDERLGWTADAQVFMNSAAYVFDTYEFLSKYLADLRDAQFEDGLYPCFAPNVRHVFPHWASAGWTDAGVLIPYRLWKWYGKAEIVKTSWPSMKKYMDFLESHETPYRINHGDWLAFENTLKKADGTDQEAPDPRQVHLLNDAFRVWMARLMREMAEATGRPDEARHFAEEEARHRAVFAERYVGGDGCLKDEYKGQCNDLYMLKLGLCGNAAAVEATKKDLIANIRAHGNRLQTGFLGTAILMPTLTFEADAPDVAYDLLLQDKFPSWLYSVDQGATTVWERWNGYTKEKGFGPVIMNSFNHYAYGCVLEWLFSAAAGIRPDPARPGWKHFMLQPFADRRLGHLEASYDSPDGRITSAWKYDADGKLVWKFTIPPGTSATVIAPDDTTKEYADGVYELCR